MDATLTELRQALANFLDHEIAPTVNLDEAEASLAPEWMTRLGKLGYLDFGAEQSDGGLGLIGEAIVIAEIARVWGALAVSVASTFLVVRALGAADPGRGLGAVALCSGAATAAIGRLPGSANGTRLVVGAPQPEILLLLPGSDQGREVATLSTAGSALNAMEYEGLRGLRGALVDETAGRSLSVESSAELLTVDRILLSAVAAGLAQGALDRGISYAGERVQFGSPIGAFGEIQALLVRASVQTVAARHTALYAAELFDDGDRSIAMSTRAFLGNMEAAVRVAERAQHVHGGYGHMREYAVGRYVRDARTLASLVGTHAELDRFLARDLGLPQVQNKKQSLRTAV